MVFSDHVVKGGGIAEWASGNTIPDMAKISRICHSTPVALSFLYLEAPCRAAESNFVGASSPSLPPWRLIGLVTKFWQSLL